MSEIYTTGSEGECALAQYLEERGHKVEPSDNKTFDLVVDGRYAEVKSSNKPYSDLGFIGLTGNQYDALEAGLDFTLYIVCNLDDPENLEVIEIDPPKLLDEEPVVELTYYWYRSQLERVREAE